ncbi:hypothetical protein RF11_00377 [Thelohanellus kitauei]|uniref:Uncharacterized protein n=1 Tax=Thelohanellus kitauei TaxID=669202 RepID=A0A0C2MUT1_THEKT|nr:hypothetical protein RF11_00377 [Thelohanellus kitauei]
MNDIKRDLQYTPSIETIDKWLEATFNDDCISDPAYSNLTAYSAHPLFNLSNGYTPNTNFKMVIFNEKWNSSQPINPIICYDLNSSKDLYLNISEEIKTRTLPSTLNRYIIFKVFCEYALFIIKSSSTGDQKSKLGFIEKLCSKLELIKFEKVDRLGLPNEIHPYITILNVFLYVLDSFIGLGENVRHLVVTIILKLVDLYSANDANLLNPTFSALPKTYQITILKVLLVMVYKYHNFDEDFHKLLNMILSSLDGHIHICYGQSTLGKNRQEIFVESFIIKNMIVSNEEEPKTDTLDDSQRTKENQPLSIRKLMHHNNLDDGSCCICKTQTIYLSDDVINHAMLVLMEYLMHHVTTSFDMLLKAIRMAYKFIVYDVNCIAYPASSSEVLSLPARSTSSIAVRFYYCIFSKLNPLRLLCQILKMQFHEKKFVFYTISFSLMIFHSEKHFVELFEQILKDITENKAQYVEFLSQIILNLQEIFNSANSLMFDSNSIDYSAKSYTLLKMYQTNKSINADEVTDTEGKDSNQISPKRKLIKSFNTLSEMIIENSGIFTIPNNIIMNYLECIVKFAGIYCYEITSAEKLFKRVLERNELEVDKLVSITFLWFNQCENPKNKLSLLLYLIKLMITSFTNISPSKINQVTLRKVFIVFKLLGGSIFDNYGIPVNEPINLDDTMMSWVNQVMPKYCKSYIPDIYKTILNLQGDEKKFIFLKINEEQILRRKRYVNFYIHILSQMLCLIISKLKKNQDPLSKNPVVDWLNSVAVLQPNNNKDYGLITNVYKNLRTTLLIMLGMLTEEIMRPGDMAKYPPFEDSDISAISLHILALFKLALSYKSMCTTVTVFDNALWFAQIFTLYVQATQVSTKASSFSIVKFWFKIVNIVIENIEIPASIYKKSYCLSLELIGLVVETVTVMKLIGVFDLLPIFGLIQNYTVFYQRIVRKVQPFDESFNIIPALCERETNSKLVLGDFIRLAIKNLLSRGMSVV